MNIKRFLLNYLKFLPLLLITLFFYLLLYFIFQTIAPASLANWLYPDSYLLVQLLLGCGNFFLITFLTQDKKLGLWGALSIFLYLFFKLAHFVYTPILVLSFILTVILLFGWIYARPKLCYNHRSQTNN